MERLGTVAIIGVGLIGGSIGLALRAGKHAARVLGIGRNEAKLAEAERMGVIDGWTTNLADGVATAEIVAVCTPVTRVAADVIASVAHGPDSLLVTDAGSTKKRIVAAIEKDPRARAAFVGAHPIAGSERKGAAYARADLFEGRTCVLTPTSQTPLDRLARARAFWSSLGCRIFEMDAQTHDESLALTSHLPHALAAALAAIVSPALLPLAGGAYRDITRVAASDPALWAGIFCENRAPLLAALDRFRMELDTFRQSLAADDEPALREWWALARTHRNQFESVDTSAAAAVAGGSA